MTDANRLGAVTNPWEDSIGHDDQTGLHRGQCRYGMSALRTRRNATSVALRMYLRICDDIVDATNGEEDEAVLLFEGRPANPICTSYLI